MVEFRESDGKGFGFKLEDVERDGLGLVCSFDVGGGGWPGSIFG